MSYTECSIGGVDLYVDPDNVSDGLDAFGDVVPSLDGTMVFKYLAVNPASYGGFNVLTISGVYLPTASVVALKGKVANRDLVNVSGLPGVDGGSQYFIKSMTHGPIKPAVIFPGDSPNNPPIRHTYNLRLIRTTSF